MKKTLIHGLSFVLLVALLASCGKKTERSATTGWKYNDTKWGGFEKLNYEGQATGPNLVPIEGGTFVMGLTDQDVTYEWNNIARRVTVSSFYMDETEVRNTDYREYLYWLANTFGEQYPEVVRRALPDTLVWRDELAYNEPLVETYFRHPSYDDYPVVGVSWNQANEFCKWRTDRVNEMILVEKGIIDLTTDQKITSTPNLTSLVSTNPQHAKTSKTCAPAANAVYASKMVSYCPLTASQPKPNGNSQRSRSWVTSLPAKTS